MNVAVVVVVNDVAGGVVAVVDGVVAAAVADVVDDLLCIHF